MTAVPCVLDLFWITSQCLHVFFFVSWYDCHCHIVNNMLKQLALVTPMSFASPLLQVRPATQRGGILFAITDARQKVVELGLALTPVRGGLQSILLYYTDREQASHSHKAAAFSVPDMTDQWTRFTVCLIHAYMTNYRIRRIYLADTNVLLNMFMLHIKHKQ